MDFNRLYDGILIIFLALLLLISVSVGYFSYSYGYKKGFSKGEDKGMNAGYNMCKSGWVQDRCEHGTMYIPPDPRSRAEHHIPR